MTTTAAVVVLIGLEGEGESEGTRRAQCRAEGEVLLEDLGVQGEAHACGMESRESRRERLRTAAHVAVFL